MVTKQKILALNAIGIKELTKGGLSAAGGSVNLEVSASEYFTLDDLEGTINKAISDAGIKSEIVKSYKIGGLNAYSEDDNRKFSENKIFSNGPIVRNRTSFNLTPFYLLSLIYFVILLYSCSLSLYPCFVFLCLSVSQMSILSIKNTHI